MTSIAERRLLDGIMGSSRLARRVTGMILVGGAACSRGPSSLSTEQDAGIASPTFEISLETAEDLRRANDIPRDALRSHDPTVRRRTARAFARILDDDDAPLLRALEDEDDETLAWAAYGLGESCKGREDSHVRALAARLVSLEQQRENGALDSRAAIVRALGRCGGEQSEATLRACLRRRNLSEAAAFALGDLASKHGSLGAESAAALLDAVEGIPPLDAALYPFGRTEGSASDDAGGRLAAAARAALRRPGSARIFAVRALGHTAGIGAISDLTRVLGGAEFSSAERAEAVRSLAHLRDGGQAAIADALGPLFHDGRALAGDGFVVLSAALSALADNVPKTAEGALWNIARLEPLPGSPPQAARRASALRCGAAEKLARGVWDSDVLAGCDVADGEAGERARLAALDRGPLVKARRGAWLELARQTRHVRVREAAVDAIGRHPELGDLARTVLADALDANEPGVVTMAANVIRAHADRVYVLALREKRAALDPLSPAPTANPEHELDSRVAAALRAAIARSWPEDLVETRAALVDAVLAVGLEGAHTYAERACHDANVTVRGRAATALAAAGAPADCSRPAATPTSAPEVGHGIQRRMRVVFDTDAGPLGVTLDPSLAPVAVTRIVSLVRSGFYDAIAIHRVVPGFAVQFGDRGGDGYGGAGRLLRCETSPVPFGALDVGMALAGRDTGSSQLFVTLARYPHLDGQYTLIGHADGDWYAVAEGDIVRRGSVEE